MEWGEVPSRWFAPIVAALLLVHGFRPLFAGLARALWEGWREGADRPEPRLAVRLGELLRRRGLPERHLERALRAQRACGHPLGAVLERLGLASPAEVEAALAEQRGLPRAAIDPGAIPRALLEALPEAEAETRRVLPLAVRDGWALVACSRRPSPAAERRLAARLGRPVRLAFASAERLRRARRIAYRRLRGAAPDGVAPARLGERLVLSGMLDEAELREALEEQQRTGEHLAALLVRRGRVTGAQIAQVALGPLSDGFVEVMPEDVDLFGLRRIGYAACAFHELLPLWGEGATRTVASAHPLHAATRRALEARLGVALRPVLAPAAQLRAARLAAARRAWPRGIHGGAIHADAAEVEALGRALRRWGLPLPRLFDEALRRGWPPMDVAVARGVLTEEQAAELLAEAHLLEEGPAPIARADGWLPPDLERRGDPVVAALEGDDLVVVTRRPRADVARALRALHPQRALRWRVAAGPRRAPRRLTLRANGR
jgi:hypothetical protein